MTAPKKARPTETLAVIIVIVMVVACAAYVVKKVKGNVRECGTVQLCPQPSVSAVQR